MSQDYIAYRYIGKESGIHPPSWLLRWQQRGELSTCIAETNEGPIYAIADRTGYAPSRLRFLDCIPDWQVAASGPDLLTTALWRTVPWCQCAIVSDLQDREWQVPKLLTGDGARAYFVAYGGPDFLPTPTEEQSRLEAMARAAREAIIAHDTVPIPMGLACRWAAAFMAASNHISIEAIAALSLLDDKLAIAAILAATGMQPPAEEPDGHHG